MFSGLVMTLGKYLGKVLMWVTSIGKNHDFQQQLPTYQSLWSPVNNVSTGLSYLLMELKSPDWLLQAKRENKLSQKSALLLLKFNRLKLFILQSLNIRFVYFLTKDKFSDLVKLLLIEILSY